MANRLHCKHDNVYNCNFVTPFMIWRFCALISISVYWPTCWLLAEKGHRCWWRTLLCQRCHLCALTRSFEQVGSQSSIVIIRHGSAGLQLHNCLVHTLFISKSDPNTEKWWFLEVEKGCRTGQKRWRQQRLFREQQIFQGMGNGTPLSSSSWWPSCWASSSPSWSTSCWSPRW